MATSATPSGAEPVDTLSASGSFTGKVRHIKVANAYNTAIFYGDFVLNIFFITSTTSKQNSSLSFQVLHYAWRNTI